MNEYINIGSFYYKKNKYLLLLDKNKKYFFMIINNNNYEYPTLKELISLSIIFGKNENVLLYENKKIKLIPKVLIGTTLLTLSLSLANIIDNYNDKINFSNTISVNIEKDDKNNQTEIEIIDEEKTQKLLDTMFERIEDNLDTFEIETITEENNLIIVHDSSALEEFLGKKENITYDTLKETLENNKNITGQFKQLYLELINSFEEKYPDMDLRIWNENLKTIKIIEETEENMQIKANSKTAKACYRIDENVIYTVKNYKYEKQTEDYQIIKHEMCHPIRNIHLKLPNNKELRTHFENKSAYGTVIAESLNSILAVRSYDENELDIAYQLQSNMLETIINCLDNYELSDFIEHNISYLENEMNKQNKNDKALEILTLIELQYIDYHNKDIKADQEVYYPIYNYISKMYYDKNINKDMTYEEATIIKDNLIERITYDVPEEYEIDTNHFNEYFNNYYNSLHNNKTK